MTLDVNDYSAMMEAQVKVREQLAVYDGDFQFLLEMKALAQDEEYMFTPRQLEATLASLIRHFNKQAVNNGKPVEGALLGDKIPMGTTRHAVENSEGVLTFIRIDRPEKGNWQGWYFVKHILGPNEFKIGAQRPNGEYRGQWPSLLGRINEDPIASIGRYGQEIGKCGICGLRLTDETSRKIGIGPICRENVGI